MTIFFKVSAEIDVFGSNPGGVKPPGFKVDGLSNGEVYADKMVVFEKAVDEIKNIEGKGLDSVCETCLGKEGGTVDTNDVGVFGKSGDNLGDPVGGRLGVGVGGGDDFSCGSSESQSAGPGNTGRI